MRNEVTSLLTTRSSLLWIESFVIIVYSNCEQNFFIKSLGNESDRMKREFLLHLSYVRDVFGKVQSNAYGSFQGSPDYKKLNLNFLRCMPRRLLYGSNPTKKLRFSNINYDKQIFLCLDG